MRLLLTGWSRPYSAKLHPARLVLLVLIATIAACSQPDTRRGASGPELPLAPVQSPNDQKAYRYIELDNGLRALLISDPDTEKAAASLDVYVGSAQNPPDRGGLAHFLEHMLFLGTAKYPDSGEYARFISEHGGSRNAYTGFEHTNYFFDIDKDHLPEALDRFAQFFIAPNFDTEYVGREVNAVHAEYQMSLNTDGRRTLDVMREVVNPDHPYSILSVGTRDTLADRSGDSVRDDLLDFYQRYYSANLMSLVVLGRQDLDSLQALVEEIFAAVPNRDVSIPDIAAPLYREGALPRQVYIEPLASQRQLTLAFPMPDYRDLYRVKPLMYLGNLLGHEGEGSLLSLLKNEGWAESLSAGSGIAYRGGSAFNISITLTEAGLARRDEVVQKVFEYIALLQREGPQRALYREQGQLSALQFRFREDVKPISYVSSLANDMHLLAPQDVLEGNFLMTDYRPRLIEEILEDYFTMDNVLVTVTAAGLPVDRESEFYQTPYSVASLEVGEGMLKPIDGRRLDARLRLPERNEFIAGNVELEPLQADNPPVPALVDESERLRIWFRQDDEFRIPKGAMYVSFRSSQVSDTAADAATAQLYVRLLQDAMNEYTYPALLAGLNFSLYTHARGVSLKISGYDDKQQVLLQRIVESVAAADLDNNRFDNIRADLVRNLENVKTTRAFRQAGGDARELLLSSRWSEESLAEELRALTPAEVEAWGRRFWRGADVDVMLNGNYGAATVAGLKDALQPLLRDQGPVAPVNLRVTRIATGADLVYVAPIEHRDSVLFWYLQAPGDDLDNRAMMALTGQVVSADFFEELRTQQQLGYVVSAFVWPLLDVPGMAMMVQSPTASATQVHEAADTFLRERAVDGAVTGEQFARHRQALVSKILEPPKNLWEESDYFWQEIARRELDFDSRERLAQAVRDITREQWLGWYRRVVLENRASLVVAAPGQWGEVPAGDRVDDPVSFRNSQPAYPRR